MDGEGSYESDISESWSLIDININEESCFASEAPELDKPSTVKLKNTKSTEKETTDFVEKCQDFHKADFGLINVSDCNASFINNERVSCSHEEIGEVHSPCLTNVECDGRNDADDVESIEILDMDGNYRDSDIERLNSLIDSHASNDSHNSQTYQSDDEESVEESFSNGCRSYSSTVIRRKRRKSSRNAESVVNSVNSFSEDKSEKSHLKENEESEGKKRDEKFSASECFERSSRAVYKHYRNNVANTVLSLSMGVIFAGVACLAIGHFLGVQDAADTAGELVETLKKLQVENAALQSRLFHLNRALLNRETNPKLEPPPGKASCEGVQRATSESRETDLNGAALSEIRSSLNSVEWLSKLQNLVRSDNKAADNGVDFKSFGTFIHDQLDVLKSRKEGGLKLLEDTDRKISKVLQKIVTRMSTFQENIENLYNRLINIKDNFNQKLSKVLPEEDENEKPRFEKAPSTEANDDLQSVRWNRSDKVTGNDLREHEKVVQFPQPEEFYRVEMKKSIGEKKSRITDSSETFKKVGGSEKKDKKEYECEKEKRKRKKREKTNKKKEESKKNELKRQKRTATKLVMHPTEKGNKNKNKMAESERAKFNFAQNFNETGSHKSKHSDLKADFTKAKQKFKREKPKLKPFLSRVHKASRERYGRPCPGRRCFNSTGYWVFKWAGGREEYRRHQAMGEWQFERAKGREVLRGEDEAEERKANWQVRRGAGREGERQSGRWGRGKEFFHDRFSWI